MEPLSANDPRTAGEFQLHARLGAGGMGRVYFGYSPAGRAVAVKVINPELARDADFRRRFAREVATARAVSGIYTAPVVASGLDDDPPWLATAYVPGPSLAEVIAGHGPLAEPAVWRLAAGLTEALQAVHACGLVHRDLKPANVLLAADGPRVIDFGISRALDGTSLTATGMLVGTPGYMSPEQAEGAPAGAPSDVFSLGCVLAYAATGNAPFGNGSAASVLYRVVMRPPDLAGVPARLREVVTACLAKNPSERPGLTSLAAMVSRAGPTAPAASPDSYWPAPVAEVIRAWKASSQAGAQASVAQQPIPAVETHTMTARQAPTAPPAPTMAPVPPTPTMAPPRPATPWTGPPSGTPWPQPSPASDVLARYRPGYPGQARRPVPGPVRTAVWLMRAGAVGSLVNTIVELAIIGQIKTAFLAQHPLAAANTVQSVAGLTALGVIVGGAIGITLWLWLASAARRGRGWARTVGTVFFGIDTLGLLITLSRPGIGAAKGIGVAIWLIGLAAVIALWQRESSDYLRLP
jgi:serine/threonine protein kinase